MGELQTAAPAYNWQVTNFQRPDKRNLVIYELLLRDFVGNHDWNTLRDTLNYIKRLGVNAVEIMPFNEFEGNKAAGVIILIFILHLINIMVLKIHLKNL